MRRRSLPLRERGLKYNEQHRPVSDCSVAPLAGAWIEILRVGTQIKHTFVAPLAGAWIEICHSILLKCFTWSLPLRERGLK